MHVFTVGVSVAVFCHPLCAVVWCKLYSCATGVLQMPCGAMLVAEAVRVQLMMAAMRIFFGVLKWVDYLLVAILILAFYLFLQILTRFGLFRCAGCFILGYSVWCTYFLCGLSVLVLWLCCTVFAGFVW